MAYDTILLETGTISTLTINRPDKLNALNAQVIQEMDAALDELEAHAAVRVLLVTGAGGKAFVAGADIGELAREDCLSGEQMSLRGQRLFRRLEQAAFVTIAVVGGFALGGGLELAMACDLRLASEKAKFGLPEVTLGIIPGYAGTQRLPRIVGQGRALEMILTGGMVKADRAFEMGLVNQVHPADTLMEMARELAGKITQVGPVAAAKAKWLVYHGQDVPFQQGAEAEASAFGLLCATEDKAEGTQAFLEKRSPEFKGR
jgi:enoyl-CoA hydratase